MNERHLLINCSNLHVGGGVAVATSFIDSLSRGPSMSMRIHVLLSSTVAENLRSLGTALDAFDSVEVVDSRGLRSLWTGLSRRFDGMDVVFTVFGPAYVLSRGFRHVCGFAQPLIVYPSNPVERQLPLIDRVLQRLKYRMQEFFFARADALIVELEHVELELHRKPWFRSKPIHVVYNTVDSVFHDPARWLPLPVSDPDPCPASSVPRLGVVSRNYPHKNLGVLPALKDMLAARHGLVVEFIVTFTDAEWQSCNEAFRRSIRNVGALVLAQCPSFYAALDGVIFPSLLECFSAVPLEAMAMRKPLFASDLPFIRDCCHEHAHYFDPLKLASMADVIAAYFRHRDTDAQRAALDRAHAFVQRYPSPDQRAQAYMAIARDTLAPQS